MLSNCSVVFTRLLQAKCPADTFGYVHIQNFLTCTFTFVLCVVQMQAYCNNKKIICFKQLNGAIRDRSLESMNSSQLYHHSPIQPLAGSQR